ncbi:bifunctional tRNA (5-methylaminomethyl-2-thiouridine)(34)-methyltransferase MnmD/FAD-dependent 5-carboxymethylaminomethyl-2-thiouridine(34) oxidoreductase MnmC, partial [Aeromonas cavernicola]
MSQPPLHHAHLDWNDAGTPISCQFGDVYFSNDNGLSETRHVFLQQNQLPARFSQHDNEVFVIGETGFGTGLNFLATCHAFLAHRANAENPVRLHFISFEKYPLTQDDLRKALAAWPELMPISQDLIDQWPLPLPGCHRLHFANDHIRLDLWLGDINDTLPQLPQHQDGLIDAWYLDGFSPAKNPEMWTQTLFDGLARLARPTATIATFTCAGFVRRGLMAAGFAMKKVKGHGKKREMLVGERLAKQSQPTIAPWYARPVGRPGDVLMIGGGIASAMTALSLVARGRRVTLLCQDSAPAIGASGNRQGALYPLLNGEHDALSRFYSLSFGYARQRLQALAKRHPVAFALCGVVQLGYDEKSNTKLGNMSQGPFPPALMHPVTSHEVEQLTGLPCSHGGIYYPHGGWLCPADLTRAAIEEAQLSGLLQVEYSTQVSSVAEQPDLWQVTSETGRQWHAPNLVVAAGHHLPALIPFAALPLYPVRGQVSHI